MIKFYLTVLLILSIGVCKSQDLSGSLPDSLQLNMTQAQDSFLSKNLSLLAQKYSIDSAKATVITAGLYNNPEFEYSNGFYNSLTHKFFEPEIQMQVSQLILLAGKRNKEINLAKSGIGVAEYQFYDLLRTFRFILRNDFYNIYFLEQSSKLYDLEISSLQKLVTAFEQQVSKGYMAPVELVRLKSQLYSLQAEYDGLQTNINNIQAELKLILRVPAQTYIVPVVDISQMNQNVVERINYQQLIDSAINDRPDLKVMQAAITYSDNNLVLQKAFAKPDITVFANYDRQGSYVRDYNGIGIGIPLPFFNRNQGNISNAIIAVEQNKMQLESGIDKVKSEVTTNYINALRSEKLLSSFDPKFDEENKNLIQEVTENYQKKNITLLQFLDYYDSYKENILQLNQLRFNKISALEQLNYALGKIVFNQ